MDLKIYGNIIEDEAKKQIYDFCNQEEFKDCKVRIMPDVHAGKDCVVGFTADLGDIAVPNLVGVDIGCGMLTYYLGQIDIDYAALDDFIKKNIPCGCNVRDMPVELERTKLLVDGVFMKPFLEHKDRLLCSIGTLGGGNHFIEIDEDEDGGKYLVIHSGSRNFGVQVANHYQELANLIYKKENTSHEEAAFEVCREFVIDKLKTYGLTKQIQKYIEVMKFEKEEDNRIYYLKNEKARAYFHDMEVCQNFASLNRCVMAEKIVEFLGQQYDSWKSFATIHNYIDDEKIVRKGAIRAKKGEIVLIPMNMRDGSIIGVGLGNKDWNYSAPHGAGRIMSRKKAKETLDLQEFKDSMNGIYSTTVSEYTMDEAPMAYKPAQEIIVTISPTVEILKIIKPVYNFKAFC